jgi:hypothetical protein
LPANHNYTPESANGKTHSHRQVGLPPPFMTPEHKARRLIDAIPTTSDWTVQTRDKINLSASGSVAVLELSFSTGESKLDI